MSKSHPDGLPHCGNREPWGYRVSEIFPKHFQVNGLRVKLHCVANNKDVQ